MKPGTLRALLAASHPDGGWPGRLLALDPGGTTGWATFEAGGLLACGQLPGEGAATEALIQMQRPALLVVEEYRLYPWVKQSFSDFPVSQLIGVIRFVAEREGIPVVMKPAAFTKSWMTDKKLRQLGLWQPGRRHANDAIRLGATFLLFSNAA